MQKSSKEEISVMFKEKLVKGIVHVHALNKCVVLLLLMHNIVHVYVHVHVYMHVHVPCSRFESRGKNSW